MAAPAMPAKEVAYANKLKALLFLGLSRMTST